MIDLECRTGMEELSWRLDALEHNLVSVLDFLAFLFDSEIGQNFEVGLFGIMFPEIDLQVRETRKSTNWWGSLKRDVTHPTATFVYNTCYHLFRKRSCMAVHLLALASWPRQQYDTSQLYVLQRSITRKSQSAVHGTRRRRQVHLSPPFSGSRSKNV